MGRNPCKKSLLRGPRDHNRALQGPTPAVRHLGGPVVSDEDLLGRSRKRESHRKEKREDRP